MSECGNNHVGRNRWKGTKIPALAEVRGSAGQGQAAEGDLEGVRGQGTGREALNTRADHGVLSAARRHEPRSQLPAQGGPTGGGPVLPPGPRDVWSVWLVRFRAAAGIPVTGAVITEIYGVISMA
jgi:hypothetical protein